MLRRAAILDSEPARSIQKAIDQNEIWSEALKTMTEGTSNSGMIERAASLKASMGVSLLALFDEELWLTPDQRKALVSQFEKSVPGNRSVTSISGLHPRSRVDGSSAVSDQRKETQ
jgi:hypothetical protein